MKIFLGRHLMLDGESGNPDRLGDLASIYNILDTIPKMIDMVAITPPLVFRWLNPPEPEWGITGIVVISTSHISIHTFPERKTLSFDCFSCRDFDPRKVVDFLCATLAIREPKVQVVER